MKGHTIKGGHKRPTKKGAGMTRKVFASIVEKIPVASSRVRSPERLKRVVRRPSGESHTAQDPQDR